MTRGAGIPVFLRSAPPQVKSDLNASAGLSLLFHYCMIEADTAASKNTIFIQPVAEIPKR
jgi:hypothetical protein